METAPAVSTDKNTGLWFAVPSQLKSEKTVVGVGLAVLVWFLYFTINPVTESIDYLLFYKANFHFLLTSLKDGELPLWNPHVGMGRPFLADLQNAVFYPPVYLMFLGEHVGLFLLIWLHYCLGFFGMRALMARLGAGRLQSWLAGAAFVLAAPLTTRLFAGQLLYVCGLCYFPLLFLCALRLENGGIRAIAGYTGVLALQFLAGHPQVFWFAVIGQGVFILARSSADVRATACTVGKYLVCVAWAVLLCAVALLPFLELVQHGNRGQASAELSNFGRFTWRYFFGFFTIPPANPGPGWEGQLFLGCVLLIPGIAGLTKVRDRNVRGLLGVFLVGLLLASEVPESVSNFFRHWVPGYGMFRLHARAGFLMIVALVASASLWLSQDAVQSQRRLILCVIGLALTGAILGCFPFQKTSGLVLGRMLPLAEVIAVAIGFLALASVRAASLKRWMIVGLLVASVTELLAYGILHRKYFAFERVMGASPEFLKQEELLTELKERFGNSTVPLRVLVPFEATPWNDGMIHGFSHCDAYTSLFLGRPWEFLHAVHAVRAPSAFNTSLAPEIYKQRPVRTRGLDVQVWWDAEKQRMIFDGTNGPSARASVVFAAEKVEAAESLRRITNGFDLTRGALVEQAVQLPTTHEASARMSAITSFSRNRMVVERETPEPGMLVISEAWYPGWKAEIEGKVSEMQPVNFWMRGVVLPPGKGFVTVFYRQNYLWLGAMISAGAVAGLVAALRFSQRSDRHCRETPAAQGDLESSTVLRTEKS